MKIRNLTFLLNLRRITSAISANWSRMAKFMIESKVISTKSKFFCILNHRLIEKEQNTIRKVEITQSSQCSNFTPTGTKHKTPTQSQFNFFISCSSKLGWAQLEINKLRFSFSIIRVRQTFIQWKIRLSFSVISHDCFFVKNILTKIGFFQFQINTKRLL
jgi:hypothetical protein